MRTTLPVLVILLGLALSDSLAQRRTPPEYPDSVSERQLQEYCERRWPEDRGLRGACVRNEREGYHAINRPAPTDVGGTDFDRARAACARKWSSPFSLRAACERNQIEALRTLKDPPPVAYERRDAVRGRCAARWPDTFDLRVACERNAAAGIEAAEADEQPSQSTGPDLSAGVGDTMRRAYEQTYRTDCQKQWGQNLSMVEHCERQTRETALAKGSAPPAPERSGFLGIAWGASANTVSGWHSCVTPHPSRPVVRWGSQFCRRDVEVAGIMLRPYFLFRDGQVRIGGATFEPARFEAIRTIMQDRYGLPTKQRTADFTAKDGRPLKQEELIWAGPPTEVILRRYDDSYIIGELLAVDVSAYRDRANGAPGNLIEQFLRDFDPAPRP